MRATRKRRWPRRLGIAVLALLGLLAAVLVGGYAWLRSGAGGERLRTFALGKVNRSIQGRLSARAVEFRGNRLILRGVELRDPEGEVVAQVEALDVTVSLGQLVHRRLDVS